MAWDGQDVLATFDDVIDEAVGDGLGGAERPVAARVVFDHRHVLSGVFRDQA